MTERRARYKTGRQSSRKCEAFGVVLDWHAERDRYLELRAMQERGEITALEPHPKYILQPAFVMDNGEKVRAITYTPDFEYIENGSLVVEDVKSEVTKTSLFRVKQKMFWFIFPDFELRIIE